MEKILHYMFFCHRLQERSFHYKGKPFPICARCTGILIGYIIGILSLIVMDYNILITTMVGPLLIIPLAIDGLGQLYNYWVSNNNRRCLTGILAGVGAIYLFRLCAYMGETHAKLVLEWLGK